MAVSPGDAMRLNIPVLSLPKATKNADVRLGGHKFKRYLLSDVKVYIRNENSRLIHIDLESISVLAPTKTPMPEEAKQIPSVLGCDFLTIGKFRLCFDPCNKEGFLERDE